MSVFRDMFSRPLQKTIGVLAFSLCAFSSNIAQGQSQKPDTGLLESASYSYLHKLDEGDKLKEGESIGDIRKVDLHLEDVISALSALKKDNNFTELTKDTELDLGALSTIPDEMLNPLLDRLYANVTTRPLAVLVRSYLQEGMPAASAIIIFSAASIGAEECIDKGKVIFGDPLLGRSEMRAVQFAQEGIFDAGTGIGTPADPVVGLGRGQFDIRTTKIIMCRDLVSNEFSAYPLNLRWVFNVNGTGLYTQTGTLTGPNGNPYQQHFWATGLDIQVVLMVINGTELPKDDIVYHVVENACIDIWFVDPVTGKDIVVPASIPGFGIFCAGGYCKNVPPGLDATH